MINELMIDIETTGQKPGCKVLSIGAFGFDNKGTQTEFYRKFSIAAQNGAGLTDDASTMEWWNKQGKEAREEAFSGTAEPKEGIEDFKLWFLKNFSSGKNDALRVWCCGVDFDFPILKHFFEVYGFSFPWNFWNQYDYRTVKKLFGISKKDENNSGKHNALEDAKAQMRGLRCFYNRNLRINKSALSGGNSNG